MKLMNSSEAAASAAVLSRVGCAIGNNEITAAISRNKEWSCEICSINSEESAISRAIGSVLKGKRVLLTDLVWLKPAAHYRIPLVSVSAGFRNWALNLIPASSQEALDMVVAGYALSENRKVLLPVNVVMDRLGAETYERVETPSQKIIDNILGELKLDRYEKHLQYAGHGIEQASQLAKAVENAYKSIPELSVNWKKRFRRTLDLTENLMLEDAELAIVTYGSVSTNAKLAVQKLRAEGIKAGLLRIKAVTPFPAKEVSEALKSVGRIAVVDRQPLTGTWSKLHHLIKEFYSGFASNFLFEDCITVAEFEEIARRLRSASEPERVWLV